jgi:hypothetical protein
MSLGKFLRLDQTSKQKKSRVSSLVLLALSTKDEGDAPDDDERSSLPSRV